jgi:hypothetical protein
MSPDRSAIIMIFYHIYEVCLTIFSEVLIFAAHLVVQKVDFKAKQSFFGLFTCSKKLQLEKSKS